MKAVTHKELQKQFEVFQVAERFFDSVVVFTLFETGVFKALASGPKTLYEIQEGCDCDKETLRATLDAAVALKVLSLQDKHYSAREAFVECLGDEESPAYMGEWITNLHFLAGSLLQLGDAIHTGSRPGMYLENQGRYNISDKVMSQAMDAYARTGGGEIADRLDFSRTRHLLDLGCGPGTYSMAIVKRNPHVQATLLDLPGPIGEARRVAAVHNMTDHLKFVAADVMDYTSEESFDTILISNMLHMFAPARSLELLKHYYQMLIPGGRVIVQAAYLNEDRTSPRWAALLNLIQRVITQDGRNHTIGETKEWLERAGFQNIQHVRFSLWNPSSCLIGERPVDD